MSEPSNLSASVQEREQTQGASVQTERRDVQSITSTDPPTTTAVETGASIDSGLPKNKDVQSNQEEMAASTAATEPALDAQKNPFWKPRPPPMMGPDGKPLSKNAMKKMLKQQQFLERKPQMRAQEKLKRKQKNKERHEAIEAGLIAPPPKRHKSDQVQTGITIGIDMSFDEMMLEKEVKSMVDQIKRCYSYNRTSEQIVHLALTSFTGTSKNEFHKRANGYELWKNFTIHEKGLEEVWPSEEVPGKEHLEKLKKLQIIASAKSEAVKAKALAAMATGAESTVEGEPVEAGSTSGSGLIVSAPESAPASDQTTATTETTTLATSASLPIATTDQPSASPTSLPSPSASEPVLSAADIKALEQERLLKEEKLATIPAVKKVVYLSADSPNTITKLDAGTCYILGGIVDKNRYPNLCQSKAEKLGIETAQLPIGDYIQMSSRRILTVNQVFEILLQFIECNDWKEAFLKVIPQRKLEDKPRQRRSVESWRPNHARDGKLTSSASGSIAGDSGSNSLAGSVVSDDESDHENDSQEGGAVDAA